MMTRQCAAILALGLLVAPAIAEEPAVFRSEKDKVSYVIGLDMARNFRRQGVECDLDFVVKGLKDGFSDEKPLIPEGDFRQTLVEIQAGVRQKQALMRGKGPVEANKKRGEIFLAENKAKDGVVALPSGMQYKILKAGDGKKPTDADTVEYAYRGALIDGSEFFRSEPGKFATSKVKEAPVPAWVEVLPLMPVGSKWRLYVPPQFAYGVQGVGHDVGPNETVIFDLELLAIK